MNPPPEPFPHHDHAGILLSCFGILRYLGYEVTGAEDPPREDKTHIRRWSAPIGNVSFELAESRRELSEMTCNEDDFLLSVRFSIGEIVHSFRISSQFRNPDVFVLERGTTSPTPGALACLAKRTKIAEPLTTWWADTDPNKKDFALNVEDLIELFLAAVEEARGVARAQAVVQNDELEQFLLGVVTSHGRTFRSEDVPGFEASLASRRVQTSDGLMSVSTWNGPQAWQEERSPRVIVGFHIDGFHLMLASSRPTDGVLLFSWLECDWLDTQSLGVPALQTTLAANSTEWAKLIHRKRQSLTLQEFCRAIGTYLTLTHTSHS